MSAGLPTHVHLNGRLLPTARARIGVFDRGLLYGDGVFETLRAYHGTPFALQEHLTRLRTSAGFLGIILPRRPWGRDIDALLKANDLRTADAAVRISVTRGEAAPGLHPPPRTRPTVIIAATRIDPSIATAQRDGGRCTLLPFARHGFLAEHKVLNYLPGVLGKVIAARHHAFEGLFVDTSGHITEGTTCNMFVWSGRRLLTPPGVGILPGLTRRFVIEIASAEGYRVIERPLRVTQLVEAQEAFVTSSLAEVVPITAIDARPIGDGAVGPHTRRIQASYRQMVDRSLARVQIC
jgi:branched-chain amino acid aminotransferase